MSRFLIQLCGSNFLLNIDGEHGKFGFTATRLIRARDVAEAERIAIIRIHQQLHQSKMIANGTLDLPRVVIANSRKLGFLHITTGFDKQGMDFFPEGHADN